MLKIAIYLLLWFSKLSPDFEYPQTNNNGEKSKVVLACGHKTPLDIFYESLEEEVQETENCLDFLNPNLGNGINKEYYFKRLSNLNNCLFNSNAEFYFFRLYARNQSYLI